MKPFELPYDGLVFLVFWSRVNKPLGRIMGAVALTPVVRYRLCRLAFRGATPRGWRRPAPKTPA